MRSDIDPRLAMLSVLSMCNAVINWRSSDQAPDESEIASAFAKLVASGLVGTSPPGKPRGRK
jgi:hypothetical protein